MWYALQDEPEKGRRLAIFAVGVVIAAALQGGGLVAAANYEPPAGLKKGKKSVVEFVVPPPPPVKEEPPPEPPKVEPEPPPPEPPKVEPPPEPPKPKPKPEPKPKPKPKPKPEPKPEPPQAPSDKPPPEKPAPVKIGMQASSTDPNATGPKVNVGNTQMGEISNQGSAPVTGRPKPGDKVVEGTPAEDPPPPPVKTRAECKLPVTSADDYPRAARRAGVTGVVVVLATIGADGVVKSARPVKTLGFGLDEKAVEIVQGATCKPATVDKVPTLAVVRLSVRFELRD